MGRAAASQPGVSDDLRELLALTPSFRLMVAHGRTDLVTPYGVSRYVLEHLPPISASAGRVQLKLYRGGHMFYFDADSRRAFTADAKASIRRATTSPGRLTGSGGNRYLTVRC